MSPDVDLTPMLRIFVAVFVLVLAADFVLMVRWLLYQFRLQKAVQEFGLVFDEIPEVAPVAPAPTNFDIGDGAALAAPQPLPYAVVPPPFAKRWSLVHPFLGMQAVLLGATVFLMIAMLVMAGVGVRLDPGAPTSSPGMQWLTILGLFAQNALFVAVPAFFFARYGLGLKGVGLYQPSMPRIGRDLLIGIGLGVVLLALAYGVEVGLSAFLKTVLGKEALDALQRLGKAFDAGSMFQQLHGFWPKLLFFLGGAVAAPFGEEVFFRGFVYNALKNRLGVTAGVILSGLIFALIHASPLGILVIFPMGMLLAYVYERTGSLWVTIVIHAVNNSVAFLSLWFAAGGGK